MERESKQYFVPDTVVWEITLNCNMKCIHCGSTAIPGVKREAELTTSEALDVIQQLADLGTGRIVFSGGEPFVRKDWETLAQETVRLGMIPSFISNGFLVDKEITRRIKALGNNVHIGISIDGNEQVHDHIRQRAGSHKRVLQAFEALQEQDVLFSCITQVNKLNLNVLSQIRDTIFQYNIYGWQIQIATPWGRMVKDLIISTDEYLILLDFIAQQKQTLGNKIYPADDMGYYSSFENIFRPSAEWDGCPAGLRIMGLTSNGSVMGCLSLQDPRFIEGNVHQRKLKDIWLDPKSFAYNRNFKEEDLEGYCRECPHRIKCRGGCHNVAYSTTGSLFENKHCAYHIINCRQQKQK